MFDYTLYPDNNNDVFEAACKKKYRNTFPPQKRRNCWLMLTEV